MQRQKQMAEESVKNLLYERQRGIAKEKDPESTKESKSQSEYNHFFLGHDRPLQNHQNMLTFLVILHAKSQSQKHYLLIRYNKG